MKRIFIAFCAVVVAVCEVYSFGSSEIENDYEFDNITELKVDGNYFNIKAEPGDIMEMHIRDAERYMDKIHFEIKGSMLEVWVDDYIFSIRGNPVIIFKVPSMSSINIKTGSGNIDLWGILSETTDLHASSGEIKINEIVVNEDLDVSVSSGNINIYNSESEELRVNSSSGEITIKNTTGEINAFLSSGNIDIENCNNDITVSSSSGNISVTDSAGNLNARTSSGEQDYTNIQGAITCESSSGNILISNAEGLLDLDTVSGNLEVDNVLVSGNSFFKTNSGTIDIDFQNSLDDFIFNVSSVSGQITIGSLVSKGRITAGIGSIVISGESTSGNINFQ